MYLFQPVKPYAGRSTIPRVKINVQCIKKSFENNSKCSDNGKARNRFKEKSGKL
jgi:hypothetical protein